MIETLGGLEVRITYVLEYHKTLKLTPTEETLYAESKRLMKLSTSLSLSIEDRMRRALDAKAHRDALHLIVSQRVRFDGSITSIDEVD